MKNRFALILFSMIAALCLCFGLAACGMNGTIVTPPNSEENDEPAEPEVLKHSYTVENVCSECGDVWQYTKGLIYELNEKTNTYSVMNIGTKRGDIVIPYGYEGKYVTSIGDNAFDECSSLTSITIPNSVTTIGGHAFSSCSGLTSITIPDSVTSIGNYAFWGCSRLTAVYISNLEAWCNIRFDNGTANPLYAGHNLYLNKQLVTKLVIPDSVTTIGDNAFYRCSSLTSIIIPNSVTSIGDNAFYICSGLTSITIPDSVTSIGNYAFSGCEKLASIVIPDTVTSIGNYAFSGCDVLARATFNNTENWRAEHSRTGVFDIPSDALANPKTAAFYLTSTYSTYIWTRSDD